MLSRSLPIASMVAALLVVGELASAQSLPLRPVRPSGLPIVPLMEGWWDNGDGSYTISFGYLNRNEEMVEVPIGDDNSVQPTNFGGTQPTAFLPGRHHGVFTVTLPPGMKDMDVWWTIEANGEETKVPGRTRATAYQLDRLPRPHGTVAPRIWFDQGGLVGQYPSGELLTLTVNVEDPSVRDPTDHRFGEPLDIAVSWFKHQGPPGEIEWVRHLSTPLPAAPEGAAAARAPRMPPANQITVSGGAGSASVQARFASPGEYMLRVRVDQFASAPDSSGGDQCCWTNGYVRVRVTE